MSSDWPRQRSVDSFWWAPLWGHTEGKHACMICFMHPGINVSTKQVSVLGFYPFIFLCLFVLGQSKHKGTLKKIKSDARRDSNKKPTWQPTTINENMASLGVDHKKKRCFCCGLELSISDTAIELDIYLILELARIWGDFTIASTIITFFFSSFFSHLIVLRYIFLQPSSWARGSCLRIALRHIQLLELYRSLSRHERRWRWTTTNCLNLMRTHSCSINLEANRICAMVYPSNHLRGRWDEWAFVFIRRSFCGTEVSPSREAHISKSAAENTCLSFNLIWFLSEQTCDPMVVVSGLHPSLPMI